MNDQKSNARQHLTAGVLAVGQHLVDHDLPAPSSIDVDHASAELTLWVNPGALPAYLGTLTVLERVSSAVHYDDTDLDIRVTRVSCLLPDTGIRIAVRSAIIEKRQP